MLKRSAPFLITLFLFAWPAFAQINTNKAVLQRAASLQAAREKVDLKDVLALAKRKGWKTIIKMKNGLATLVGVDSMGYPLYVSTNNTGQAAATIGTNQLWVGGSLGLNLSGSSNNMIGKLGIWDGGRVLSSHVELQNRVIQKDIASLDDHATHVSGIMIGAGINPLAKGMAYGTQELIAYNYIGHISEMQTEAGNQMLISNHSYTSVAGWNYNDSDKRWEFWGHEGDTEDYKFGFYSEETKFWDAIAYNAPYYLIVKAAGNNRTLNGPAVGEPYFRFFGSSMLDAGNRPTDISSNDGYDVIATYGTAKNILTVGAIQPLSAGYSRPEDVVIADFSSWGPTDDGRIKPDVVADGVNLLSAIATSNDDYKSLSGTSMASPTVSASAFLLQEYYSQLHEGNFLKSSTLKGIIIHTADEAGANPGPDYQFGWGVVNMQKAAEVIKSMNTDQLIAENVLNNGNTFTSHVTASGKGPLTATICWTDPEAQQGPEIVNDRTSKLINDLDIRIKNGSDIYMPWILNPLVPTAAAALGDNKLDNVEKIEIPTAVPGEEYTIEVKHKGTLANSLQAYSLIVSGIGGTTYCSSKSLATGARITQFKVGTVTNNPSSCHNYSKFVNSGITFHANQLVTADVTVGSCDAGNATKVVKIFIDYNLDGDFNDAGENVATSDLINTNGNIFSSSFTMPGDLQAGFSTIMRVIVQEATDAAQVNACGNYAKGETQDYKVDFINPSIDLSIPGITSPDASGCPSSQLVSIRIKNTGSLSQKDIPVSTIIKNGDETIATLNAVYPGTIDPGREVVYTYPTRFNAQENNYTFITTVAFPGDQNAGNDQQISTISVSEGSNPPKNLRAAICGNTVLLRAMDNAAGQIFWYDSPTSTTPIASGRDTNSKVITSDKMYYAAFNDAVLKVGAKDKSISSTGFYDLLTNNYIKFTASSPFTIESARLYVGSAGKLRFTIGKVIDDAHHQTISVATIDVYATDPTPQSGTQPYDPSDMGAIFQLNLPVTEAGDYILIVECLDGATLLYNNGITSNPYPFTIPEVISITGNSAPSNFQRFYVALYDIAIKLSGCASARIPISATDCNEGIDFKILYGPNPATNGKFNLRFQLGITADLSVSIINAVGQRVYAAKYPAFSGSFNQEINTAHLSKGLYLIKIEHGGNRYVRKLIIQK